MVHQEKSYEQTGFKGTGIKKSGELLSIVKGRLCQEFAKKNAKPVEAMPDESYAFIPPDHSEEKLVRRRGDQDAFYQRLHQRCLAGNWSALTHQSLRRRWRGWRLTQLRSMK